jgi:hypothetical protein
MHPEHSTAPSAKSAEKSSGRETRQSLDSAELPVERQTTAKICGHPKRTICACIKYRQTTPLMVT